MIPYGIQQTKNAMFIHKTKVETFASLRFDNLLIGSELEPLLSFTKKIGSYPSTVTVSSKGGAASRQGYTIGVYKKTLQKFSGLPVWKKIGENWFLYYRGNI